MSAKRMMRVKVASTHQDLDWCDRREEESSHRIYWLMPDPPVTREDDDYEDVPVAKIFGRLSPNHYTAKGKWSAPEADERLDQIVRAVNCHDDLVKALTLVLAWISGHDPNFIHDPDWPDDYATILAALAKAQSDGEAAE